MDPGEDIYSVTEAGVIDYSKVNGVLDGPDQDRGALEGAIWAIVPLCSILLLVLMGGLRQKPKYLDELIIGISCAVIGMCLFNLGISLGLTPLGEQLGEMLFQVLHRYSLGKVKDLLNLFLSLQPPGNVAILFGFILGYGATLAEPALNALGATVEKITVGAFKKNLLMQAVATGVALGIATGVAESRLIWSYGTY